MCSFPSCEPVGCSTHAKLGSVCLTLYDPMDYSLLGSCPWDYPGENTGVSCHSLLQGIFPTQGWNPHLLCLLQWWRVLYHWHHLGSPSLLTVASWPAYRFLRRQIGWSLIPKSLRIFQFVVIHTVKSFSVVSEEVVDVGINLLGWGCY